MRKRHIFILLALTFIIVAKAENITFADANVKAICVANWDMDKDQELSFEEAAAVTSLGAVFREKTNIGSFNELQYFTGLTAIDDYSFYKSSIGPEIIIPGNIKEICRYAFNGCKQLQRVILQEGVEKVGYLTFSGPVTLLSLPASLTSMSSTAINPYVNGDPGSGIFVPEGDLYVKVHATTPAVINEFAFYYLFAEGHLIVPMGCIEAYKSVAAWSHFGEYIEAGDVNRDGVLDQTDVTLMEEMVNENEDKDENVKKDIADINGDGVVNETDINLLKEYLGSTTAITEAETATGTEDGATYNLAGQRVDSSYRGLVIRNGRKYVQR